MCLTSHTQGAAHTTWYKTGKNITFEGITFTAPSNIQSSYEYADGNEINGVTFRNCNFNIGSTASGGTAIPPILWLLKGKILRSKSGIYRKPKNKWIVKTL
jgi:hypothetical protein